MKVNINRGKWLKNDAEEITKVRAIIKTEDNLFLIVNYDGVYMFPGGKVEASESLISAIKRELNEELGIMYDNDELIPFMNVNQIQKNYPKRDGTIVDRKVKTCYFLAPYKGLDLEQRRLSDKEKEGHLKLEFVTEDELNNIISNYTSKHPRTKYFIQELECILRVYKDHVGKSRVKKIKS